MPKKGIVLGVIVFLLILLVPIPKRIKDGGTVEYKAILYTITNYHQLDAQSSSGYRDGISMKIFGKEIYNNFEDNLVDVENENLGLEKIVKVQDSYYYDTGRESTIMGRCGVMDGQIRSHVSEGTIPVDNNQSNFEGDYTYQFGFKNTIEVYMDEKWIVFERRTFTEIYTILSIQDGLIAPEEYLTVSNSKGEVETVSFTGFSGELEQNKTYEFEFEKNEPNVVIENKISSIFENARVISVSEVN